MDLAALLGMGMGQQRQAPPAPPLMRFKAGKLEASPIEGTTQYNVKPLHKRGEILLVKSPQNELRFQWKDRSTGNVDDDLLVYPAKTCEFTRVDTGRPEDRVYLLQYKNSNRRLFCWMQEKSDEKDAEIAEKIGKYLDGTTPITTSNQPTVPLLGGDMRTNASTAASTAASGTTGNLSLNDLDAFFAQGIGAGNTGNAATPAPTTSTPAPATATEASAAPAPAPAPLGLGDWDEEQTLRRALEESMRDASSTPSSSAESGGGGSASATAETVGASATGVEETPSEPKKEEDKKDD